MTGLAMSASPAMAEVPEPIAGVAASPLVQYVPAGRLLTSLACLRSNAWRPHRIDDLAELPLRVVEVAEGYFEVIDGFKRLERWRDQGRGVLPVVVEKDSGPLARKALLLRANAPIRTRTPMDEARVIRSLVEEDHLTAAAAARLLGQKKDWTARRLTLARKLSPSVQDEVDRGSVGPTLAYDLAGLPPQAQEDVLRSAKKHGLRPSETARLGSAWLAAATDAQRAELLRSPLPTVRPERRDQVILGPLANRLEEQLAQVERALEVMAAFELPEEGLSDAERRRLEARMYAVRHRLLETARLLAERIRTPAPPDPVGVSGIPQPQPGPQRKQSHGPAP